MRGHQSIERTLYVFSAILVDVTGYTKPETYGEVAREITLVCPKKIKGVCETRLKMEYWNRKRSGHGPYKMIDGSTAE